MGSASAETVAQLLKSVFAGLDREPMQLQPQTPFHNCPGQDAVEVMEVTQGKLCMGFATPITNRDPEFPAMQMHFVLRDLCD